MLGETATRHNNRDFWLAIGLSLFAALVFGATTKDTMHDFNYTGHVASALLQGHVGLDRHPGSWMNEFVPLDGKYYSVFPLGAVLSVLPVAFLQKLGWVHIFPARLIGEFIVGLCVFFFFQLSSVETRSLGRRILLALFPIFGTWTWCNLGFGGSWQLALGFALLGEVGALYFTLVEPSPFAAGAFFALAFGNRTELILTLPIYFYLIWRTSADVIPPGTPNEKLGSGAATATEYNKLVRSLFRGLSDLVLRLQKNWWRFARFLIVPIVLDSFTAAYNLARFHSIFDFGYTRIPNVLQEPWYQHGLFSLHAVPANIHHMLFGGFGDLFPRFPYLHPYGFGSSIFIASPFLFLLFREGGKYKVACWLAIALLTAVLWTHGNPGGWQFSYRYATILLPWMFLLLVGNGPAKASVNETSLFVISVAINAAATYQFLWTNLIHP
jgi:hypothetical protein